METGIKDIREDLRKLVIDVALIKDALLEERKLTDWAKKELKNAREEDEKEYTPLEEL